MNKKIGLVAIMMCSALLVVAQLPENKQKLVQEYYKDRIANTDEEDYLKPVAVIGKIKVKDIEKGQEEVWKTWKNTFLAQDILPNWTDVVPETKNYPVHSWVLKRENPMPFYWVRKGKTIEGQKYAFFLNLHGSGPKCSPNSSAIWKRSWNRLYAYNPMVSKTNAQRSS